ncbi:quinone oxidoreductase-like protein 2 isoform X1 [Petaurus breviceps papuanus]|uniref:quinone oxidoreductase-like protein 2 isoform X1 n=1 Tax=Petaurus breviceps papuanus TaxID=3040969 RepID=UPI0036D93F42
MAAAGLARCLFRRSFPTTLPSWLLDRKDRPCCFRYYRAAICRKLKVPLAIEEVPVRPIQPDEVRVDVHFCGVNFADILTCRGLYQEKPSLPFIPGLELAGQVLEIGTNVSTVKKGDRVISVNNFSTMAEQCIVDKKKLWQIPDGISYQEAAALPVCYGTALLALEQRAQTQPGETVLVTAAAGATGLALIDVASNILQAKVIAAAGSDEKCKLALQRGAKAAVNYSQSNLKEELKSLTGGQGVNVVIDAVGGNVCLTALRSLAWEGRMVVIGFTGGEIMSIPSNLLLVKNVSAMGVYWTRYQQENFPVFSRCMSLALQYCQEGSIRPYIGGVFKLEEINDAFESVTQRKTTGKVLLSVK